MEKILDALKFEFSKDTFLTSILLIIGSPLFWNAMGRIEYYYHTLSWLAMGNKYAGCYFLSAMIFIFSRFRDYYYTLAIDNGTSIELPVAITNFVGPILIAVGTILVVSSSWRLGIIGTFMGDYFGILMEGGPIKGFPFNVTNHPMYGGSSLIFLGEALCKSSATGLWLTAFLVLVYTTASLFEGPFLKKLYADAKKK